MYSNIKDYLIEILLPIREIRKLLTDSFLLKLDYYKNDEDSWKFNLNINFEVIHLCI